MRATSSAGIDANSGPIEAPSVCQQIAAIIYFSPTMLARKRLRLVPIQDFRHI
jgi:hypothetical protein